MTHIASHVSPPPSAPSVDASVLGTKGWVSAVREAGAVVVVAHKRLVRGDAAALDALRARGLDVSPWWGPRDASVSDAAWAWRIARGRPSAWVASVPVGATVRP